MTNSSSKTDAKPNRQARRKEATRNKLVNAAVEIFSDKGINNTNVNDITERADVAYGTFYNYFNSIEELPPQVIRKMIRDHVSKVQEKLEGIDDIVLIVAISVRELMKKVMSDKTMHWLSERPVIMVDELMSSLYDDADKHHRIGVESGRFSLPASRDDLHVFCSWGLTGLLQQAFRNKPDPKELGDTMVSIYLRVLGVPDDEVKKALAKSR
jgi:AcrR family transcriptional regulator